MSSLLSILDFVVLLLLIVLVSRTVWKGRQQGSGSLILSVFTAVALIVFAIVSFSSYLGLVEVSSSLTRGIFLVILIVLAALLRLTWSAKPAA
jgi:hypothetical protein